MGKRSRLKKINKYAEKNIPQPSANPVVSGSGLRRVVISILFLAILSTGITLRIDNLSNVVSRSPDEHFYTAQANTLIQKGLLKGTRFLVKEFNSNKELWIYPPPYRVGYIGFLAGVMKLINNTDINVGAYISCAFSIISLLVLVLLGLRIFNPWITLFALLFISVSPMDLAIARRTWQESMLGCLGALILYLTCKITRDTRKIFYYIPLVLIGGYCFLIKELAAAFYGLSVMWLLWTLFFKERAFFRGLLLISLAALSGAVSILILSYTSGSFEAILETLRNFKTVATTAQYAIDYQSGPWYYFVQGFWILSPTTTILFFVGILGTIFLNNRLKTIAFIPSDENNQAILYIIFLVLTLGGFLSLMPNMINLRFASTLYIPFYLLGGVGLWYLISLIKLKVRNFSFYLIVSFIIAAAMAFAARDYYSFDKIFLKTGIKDVSIRMLREFSR